MESTSEKTIPAKPLTLPIGNSDWSAVLKYGVAFAGKRVSLAKGTQL